MQNAMKVIFSMVLAVSSLPALGAEALDDRHPLAVELVKLIATNIPDEAAFRKKIMEQVDQVMPQLKLDERDSALFREAALGATETITAEYLIGIAAEAYAKRLTAEELRGVVAFYKSDAGKAWLREKEGIAAERSVSIKAAADAVFEDTKQRFEILKRQAAE